MFNVPTLTQLYCGYTLVDVTKSDVIRAEGRNYLQRNQQRNWETLFQLLNIRFPLTVITAPEITILNGSEFCQKYSGDQRVWTFKFGVAQDNAFSINGAEFGLLELDFENVPILTGLNETARIETPVFNVSNDRNVFFERIKS